MLKYLIVFAVVALVVALLIRRPRRSEDEAGAPPPQAPQASGQPQEMVRCAHCQLHLPVADALVADGRHYCGEEHRRLGPR